MIETRRGRTWAALALSILLAAGCAAPAPGPGVGTPPAEAPLPPAWATESLHATLWIQSAAEYRAAALQAYATAARALERALDDRGWTAAPEQEGDFGDLPPAVILDVDETVLDNSPYQARLIRAGRRYTPDTWHAWCEERRATPVPGALEFTLQAAARGVTVFYVTNRRQVVQEATRDNLRRFGFPLAPDRETVLTRGAGGAGWELSDKGPRRRSVASDFRVLLLVGDNLGDFLSGIDASPAEREALIEPYAAWWGERWIVLPNPIYGSWEEAALGPGAEGLSDPALLRRKLSALRAE